MTTVVTGANRPARAPIVLTATRADLIDAGFVVALSTLALLGFRTTYVGWNYLIAGLAGVLLGIAIGHLANALRQPMITVAAMAVAVFFLLGGALTLRTQALGGVLPTSATLRGLASISIHGWKELVTTLPPVAKTGALLAIPYILGLLGGAGGFTMARRLRGAAAPLLAPVLVLTAVILLGTLRPAAQLWQGAVFTALALGWASVRGLRLRPAVQNGSGRVGRAIAAVVLLAVAGAVAAYAGPRLPGNGPKRVVLRQYVTPPFDVGQYPSPLAGFRQYTKDASLLAKQVLFTETGLPAGDFIQLATLDSYNGTVWGATSATTESGSAAVADSFQRVGTQIASSATGTPATLHITIEKPFEQTNDINAWLPTAGTATSVVFAGPNATTHAADFRYNLWTSSGIVADRLKDGDSYTVHTILSPADEANEAEPAATAQPSTAKDSAVVMSGFTRQQADTWSKGVNGAIAQALQVGAHLVSAGAYSDGGLGQGEFLPGHSIARLQGFLSGPQPVGDDEQFGAAFALMANALGVPARVVLGAKPENGVVTGSDVHVWVQLELANGSWVSLPTGDFTPTNTNVKTPPQQDTTVKKATVVPPPNVVRPPSSLTAAQADDSTSSHAATAPKKRARGGFHLPAYAITAAKFAGPPILALALVAALIVGWKARRRRRRRTRGPTATRLAQGWHELVDHARDLGIVIPGGVTRREEFTRFAAQSTSTVLVHRVEPLAVEADAGVFGPGEPDEQQTRDYWSRIDQTRRAMSRNVGRLRSWRAALSLRSLRARPTVTVGNAQ